MINFENLGRWKEGRKEGWVEGRMEAKAGLRIAYSNQKVSYFLFQLTDHLKMPSRYYIGGGGVHTFVTPVRKAQVKQSF